MKKIKIALDVDGVLLNFLGTISQYIVKSYNLSCNLPESVRQYDLFQRFDEHKINEIDFSKVKEAFEKEGHWKKLQPMPESDLIQDLIKNPLFDIYFVTSIPVHLHNHRLENLNMILNADIDDEKLICVPLGVSKKSFIENIKPDFFVEDNYRNLVDCKNNHCSIWVDLKEEADEYDLSNLENDKFVRVNTFNEAVQTIRKNVAETLNKEELIKKIATILTDDLLTPAYKKLKRSSPTEGHCYASAEAMYHLLGGSEEKLIPCVASFEENGIKMTHWWLRDKDNNIIDPTAEQFYAVGSIPPYEKGKGSGFLTKYPSKRAFKIIERITTNTPNLQKKTKNKL